MKLEVLVILISGIIATYLLYCKLTGDVIRRGGIYLNIIRDHYTTVGGSWVLQWQAPTVGTPPFTYDVEIHTIDEHGVDVIVQSASDITTTSIVLDPTKLIPNPNIGGGYQSDISYTAIVKAVNGAGEGPAGQLDFTIYDTPTITQITNIGTSKIVYPGGASDIFIKTGANSYTVPYLIVDLADEVPVGGVVASLTYTTSGTSTTYPVTTTGPKAGFATEWSLQWVFGSGGLPTIGPNTQVAISLSFGNEAGKGVYTNTFTTPGPDPVPPGIPRSEGVSFVSKS